MKKYTKLFPLVIFLIFTINICGNPKIDSLLNELKSVKGDSIKYSINLKIGNAYTRINRDSAIFYYNQSLYWLNRADLETPYSAFSPLYGKMGNTFLYQGKIDSARLNYTKALDIYKQVGDKKGASKMTHNIGVTYWMESNYPKTLEYNIKALTLREEIKDSAGISATLLLLGNIYMKQEQFQKALDSYKRSAGIKSRLKQKNVAMAWQAIGAAYTKLKNYNLAHSYTQKALEQYLVQNYKSGIASCYSNLSVIYEEQNRFEENITLLKKALKIKEEEKDSTNIAITLNNLSNLHYRIADSLKAKNDFTNVKSHASEMIGYSKRALYISTRMNNLAQVLLSAKHLKNAYSLLGNYKKAYEYSNLYIDTQNEINSEDKTKALAEMQTKYETEKKEQENTLLKKDNELNQKTIYAIGVFALLVIALAIVFFRGRQKQKMINTELEDKNNLISDQKEEIEAQANTLKEALDKLQELDQFKESMTSMIVHDLKNPLNSILNVPSSYSESKKLEYIKQNGKRMLNLVMNILDVNKFENANITLDLAEHTIFDTANSAVEQINLLAEEKDITLLNNIPAGLTAHIDNEMIQRVMVNLLTNAVKYTPVNGKILLDSNVLDEQKVRISVTDNGSGIPTDKLSSVFDKFGQVEARKSGEVRSTGIGLTFCKMAVEAHKGTIGVESKEGKGTTFWFELNFSKIQNKVTKKSSLENNSFLIDLDDRCKTDLRPYAEELSKLSIYEISAIRKVLQQIDSNSPECYNIWKDKIFTTVRNGNRNRYNELINIVLKN